MLLLLVLFTLGGCATTPTPSPRPEAKRHRVKHSPALEVKRVRPPKDTVNRQELERTLEEGIGRFLQRVRVAPARDTAGRFVGYQIVELFPGENARVSCPRPGDGLQTVNGTPIGRPDQLYGIWQTLGRVDRIDILVMRGGHPVQCAFHVVGEPSAPLPETPDPGTP